jgi:hypothetical protein
MIHPFSSYSFFVFQFFYKRCFMPGWIGRLRTVFLGRRARERELPPQGPPLESLENVMLVPFANPDDVSGQTDDPIGDQDTVYLRRSYLDHVLGTDADRN